MQHYYKNDDNDQDLFLTQKYKNKVIFNYLQESFYLRCLSLKFNSVDTMLIFEIIDNHTVQK